MMEFPDQVRTEFHNALVAFQEFSKNYLSILIAQLFFVLTVPAVAVVFVSLDLNLNDSEFVMLLLSGSFLQYCHKLPDVFT